MVAIFSVISLQMKAIALVLKEILVEHYGKSK